MLGFKGLAWAERRAAAILPPDDRSPTVTEWRAFGGHYRSCGRNDDERAMLG